MTIGARIKAARTAVGMTQNEVGKLCDIDAANIRKYESGRQKPKIETVQKLADALDVPLALLMGLQPFPDPFLSNNKYFVVVITGINMHFDKEIIKENAPFNVAIKQIAEIVASLDICAETKTVTIVYPLAPRENEIVLTSQARITAALAALNEAGQQKAVERVEELAEIPKYQKKPDEG